LLEHFLEVLETEEVAGDIKNDHNMVALFLHEALDRDEAVVLNQPNEAGLEIDVHLLGRRAEVKTTRNVSIAFVPAFVGVYFKSMVDSQGDKESWWLAFFSCRSDAEDIIGAGCPYYLTAIEIGTGDLELLDLDLLAGLAMNMSKATHEAAHEEDDLDASVLLQPVDNIVPMDRMRKKMDQVQKKMDAMIKAHAKDLAEKDKVIAGQAETIAEQAKEIAEMKKKFGLEE
jgi:hypothetical protein